MPETWLTGVTLRLGPATKQGYPSKSRRSLSEIKGDVKHSMEGNLASALGELDKLSRQASWTLSVPKSGPALQHYPLESITWTNGSLQSNVQFVGIEHEGVAGELLNAHQVAVTTELTRQIRALTAAGVHPPQRQVNLWEHREMTAFGAASTACPSGRIPWALIIAGLEEDDMTSQEVQAAVQAALEAPQTKLGGKSLLDYINASDDYVLDTMAQVLEEAAKKARSRVP